MNDLEPREGMIEWGPNGPPSGLPSCSPGSAAPGMRGSWRDGLRLTDQPSVERIERAVSLTCRARDRRRRRELKTRDRTRGVIRAGFPALLPKYGADDRG
jgi:hypothetical protein